MGHGEERTDRGREEGDNDRLAPYQDLGDTGPVPAGVQGDLAPDDGAGVELRVAAPEPVDGENLPDFEALYGVELGSVKNTVNRWRVQQAKEAFRIGDIWADLTERLAPREVSAFLANECQIPKSDVARYVRLAETFDVEHRELLVAKGVAVSVLLDLAGQDEIVRNEAIAMIVRRQSF